MSDAADLIRASASVLWPLTVLLSVVLASSIVGFAVRAGGRRLESAEIVALREKLAKTEKDLDELTTESSKLVGMLKAATEPVTETVGSKLRVEPDPWASTAAPLPPLE